MKILIMGAGAYGLALSNILEEKNEVTVYSTKKEEIIKLNKKHTNKKLFKNIKLSKNIKFTSEFNSENIEIILIALPTSIIKQEILKIKDKINKNIKIIIASKGMHETKFAFEIVKELIPNEINILSGPSFAIDTINKNPIILTLAGETYEITNIFNEKYIKIETTNDVIGTALCGTLKNILAISFGIIEGMKLSPSTKASFFTKILNETKDIIKMFSGSEDTIMLSCGIGDMILTCTSNQSRNYNYGYMLTSSSQKKIKKYITNTTIEGLIALKNIKERLTKLNQESSIINIIYNIIYCKENPYKLIEYCVVVNDVRQNL